MAKLSILIQSFGYHKGGYPADTTGHGGGFVFDCRHLMNPGRLNGMMRFTGRDTPVIRILDDDQDVTHFFQGVRLFADIAIGSALQANWEYLTFNFGCTGGQHRSVYCAERLVKYIHEEYDKYSVLNIQLKHREEKSWPKKFS